MKKNDDVKEKYVKQFEGEWVHQQHIYTFTKYFFQEIKQEHCTDSQIFPLAKLATLPFGMFMEGM